MRACSRHAPLSVRKSAAVGLGLAAVHRRRGAPRRCAIVLDELQAGGAKEPGRGVGGSTGGMVTATGCAAPTTKLHY